jgi:hypothetical protein
VIIDPADFSFVEPKNIKEDIEIEGGDFVFELPVAFGGTLADDFKKHKDSLMAFDITKTSAAEAQKAFEA